MNHGRRGFWSTLTALTVLLHAYAGTACSDARPAHLPSSLTEANAAAGSDTGQAQAGMTGTWSYHATPTAMLDAGTEACQVSLPNGFERSADCPALRPESNATCDITMNAACVYPGLWGPERGLFVATCPEGSPRVWKFDSASCAHECPAPQKPITPLDAISCAERDWQACDDGLTAQAQLDVTLANLLSSQHICLGIMQSVVVSFEDGCPTSLSGFVSPGVTSTLLATLAGARWTCARDLNCAGAAGPAKGPP